MFSCIKRRMFGTISSKAAIAAGNEIQQMLDFSLALTAGNRFTGDLVKKKQNCEHSLVDGFHFCESAIA